MLGVIIHETDRLNVVVSEFLDYARPFELSRSPEDLGQVVNRALATLRAQGLPPGVELRETLAADLPLVRLDPARMGQVTLNLLHNAVQAMPTGGRLTVHTRRARDRTGRAVVELQVQDTGAGIGRQELEKLFVPFFTTKPQGTGLGLAICQRIVQAHGGEIDVMSVVGEGSTFSVRLPVDEER
jgi:two-component system sensor histidine kinase HydH